MAILCLISIYYCFKSLNACMTADLAKASWMELFKIGVNILVLVYLYNSSL